MNDNDVTAVLERLVEPLDDEVGRWDDVLRRAAKGRAEAGDEEVARIGSAPDSLPAHTATRDGRGLRRRRRRVALLIAAVLVVGTASALGVRPIILGSGTTALPPENANPSTPASGRLILHYHGRPEGRGFPGRFVPVNQVWVYADGRVIWRREGGPFGVSDPSSGDVRTGILERRLTPAGVRLLQSKVISTRLFDRNLDLRSWNWRTGLTWGRIDLRRNNGFVSVVWCCHPGTTPDAFWRRATIPTPTQGRALGRLTNLLSDPAAHLPASAWEDEEVRAYVPRKYAICFFRGPPRTPHFGQPLDPSRIVSVLPLAAQAFVRDEVRTYFPVRAGIAGPQLPRKCSEVTTRQARELDHILSRAGFEREPQLPSHPGTATNVRYAAPNHTVMISFEPILPHGQWEGMGG